MIKKLLPYLVVFTMMVIDVAINDHRWDNFRGWMVIGCGLRFIVETACVTVDSFTIFDYKPSNECITVTAISAMGMMLFYALGET